MKVVILCGGRGERMRPLTDDRPKPLVEVGGRALLWHIMKHYARHGFDEFVLACGYKGDAFRKWLEFEDSRLGCNNDVIPVDTGEDTQTGGRLLRCHELLVNDDTFMLTYGDGLSDVDLEALVEFHRGHGKLATVTAVRPRLPWGVMDVWANGAVARFEEKPPFAGCFWANAGFFVFNRAVLDRIALGDQTRLEADVLPVLADEEQLMAYRHTGFFKGVDMPADVAELNRLWDEGKAPWRTW